MKDIFEAVIKFIFRDLSSKKSQLSNIMSSLDRLILLIDSNDTPQSILQEAVSLRLILKNTLTHGLSLRPRSSLLVVIFRNLILVLKDLINDISSPNSENSCFNYQLYCVYLRFLEYRLDQTLNIPINLDDSMCESEKSQSLSLPPRWHRIFSLLPVSIVIFLFRYFIISQPISSPNSFSFISPCRQQNDVSEISPLDQRLILVNGPESEYLKRIDWTFDSLPQHFNRSNPSASEIAEAFDYFLKHQNEGNQLRNNKTNKKSRNVIANNLPWIRILANNERIDRIKENANHGTVNIFNVLLFIPFNGLESFSPPALSLGILKGIDLAQNRLITLAEPNLNKSNSTTPPKITNLIKVKILDEGMAASSDKASRHILDLVLNDPIVGIAGLGQDTFEKLYNNCPNDYRHIPVITSSIRYSRDLTKDIPALTLLPTLHEIAESILNDIKKRRGDDTEIQAKPEKLIVVYDKSELSSTDLADSICSLVEEQYKNYFPKCKLVEISSNNPKDKQDSLNFNENNSHELILTVNPFAYKDRKKIVELILDYIQSFVQSKAKTGWMYVSPFFMDKLLEDHILKKACTQVDGQECSQVKSEFYFIRVAPMDWRTVSTVFPEKDLFAKIKDPYGKHLNWSTISSYNNLMALHELIDKAVSISESQDFSGRQVIAETRAKISDKLRESEYEFENTVAGKIRVELRGSEKLTRGDDIKILPAKIQIFPFPSVGSKSE